MFVGVCSTGNFGIFMLWACVWFPIGASIKMEFEVANRGRYLTQGKVQTIGVEGGGTIQLTKVAEPSADLTLGMSMNEP